MRIVRIVLMYNFKVKHIKLISVYLLFYYIMIIIVFLNLGKTRKQAD